MIKEFNPVEVTDHAVSNGYKNLLEFCWWVSNALNKWYRILAKVKAIFQKAQKYIFGVQVPIDVAESKNIGNDN